MGGVGGGGITCMYRAPAPSTDVLLTTLSTPLTTDPGRPATDPGGVGPPCQPPTPAAPPPPPAITPGPELAGGKGPVPALALALLPRRSRASKDPASPKAAKPLASRGEGPGPAAAPTATRFVTPMGI
jgi:hypothetical protein